MSRADTLRETGVESQPGPGNEGITQPVYQARRGRIEEEMLTDHQQITADWCRQRIWPSATSAITLERKSAMRKRRKLMQEANQKREDEEKDN